MSTVSILHDVVSLMFPSHLLEYFDLVEVRERPIAEKDRQGVESGELIFHLEERDEFRGREDGHTYRPNGFYEASRVRDFPPARQEGDAAYQAASLAG